jgi:hypothetical protein
MLSIAACALAMKMTELRPSVTLRVWSGLAAGTTIGHVMIAAVDTVRWRQRGVIAALFCVSGGFAGCGGPFDASVSGKITIDGKIVPCGMVTFQPKAGGPISYARIEENGTYILRTGREAGLPPGQYDVTVTANEPPTATRSEGGGPPPLGKAITPDWYRSKATSGLSFVVDAGNNEINLELTSQLPPGRGPRGRSSE